MDGIPETVLLNCKEREIAKFQPKHLDGEAAVNELLSRAESSGLVPRSTKSLFSHKIGTHPVDMYGIMTSSRQARHKGASLQAA